VILPLMHREIPIIRDGYVDRASAPAPEGHPGPRSQRFRDRRRHDLPSVKVIGDDGA
jgi:valyl-tRNA synthetase